jgi:hypothetical protein
VGWLADGNSSMHPDTSTALLTAVCSTGKEGSLFFLGCVRSVYVSSSACLLLYCRWNVSSDTVARPAGVLSVQGLPALASPGEGGQRLVVGWLAPLWLLTLWFTGYTVNSIAKLLAKQERKRTLQMVSCHASLRAVTVLPVLVQLVERACLNSPVPSCTPAPCLRLCVSADLHSLCTPLIAGAAVLL